MDKMKAKAIQEAVQKLVADHPEWGVKVAKNTASYLDAEVRLSITMRETDNVAAEQKAFARVAHFYGLKADAYGATLDTRHGTGRLVGFNTRRPKYPVRVNVAGTEYLYTEDILRKLPAELKQPVAFESDGLRVVEFQPRG